MRVKEEHIDMISYDNNILCISELGKQDTMIRITHDNREDGESIIHSRLRINNRAKCEWIRENEPQDINIPTQLQYNFIVYDGENVIGGAIGCIKYGWYFLDMLYVNEEYRGEDVGSEILNKIWQVVEEQQLVGIHCKTWDFQARGFYEKNGFKVFGELKDYPPGVTLYFLSKYK